MRDRPDLERTNGPAPDEAFYAAVHEWRTSPVLSEREKLAIEYAEKVGLDPKALALFTEGYEKIIQGLEQLGYVDQLLDLAAASGDDSPFRIDEPYRRALRGIHGRLYATAVATLVILYICKFTTGLRVSEEGEVEGLDLALHGEALHE